MRTRMVAGEDVGGGRKRKSTNPDAYVWLERMAEKGWTAPTWPKDYGGGGLPKDEFLILLEELQRIKARPPLGGMGITMIGPTLLEYGTEDQKKRHLPSIINGDIAWCQGYSEPGAGSDLASLQTKAESQGDHYLVNGSKIWTSGAMHADWIFCLVRTNAQVPKHEGISFLLLRLNDESSIAFVCNPEIEGIEVQMGVTHAGNPGANSAAGTMQHLALKVKDHDEMNTRRATGTGRCRASRGSRGSS